MSPLDEAREATRRAWWGVAGFGLIALAPLALGVTELIHQQITEGQFVVFAVVYITGMGIYGLFVFVITDLMKVVPKLFAFFLGAFSVLLLWTFVGGVIGFVGAIAAAFK